MSLGVTLSNIRLLSPFLKVQDKFSFQYRETTDVLNLFAAGCLSVAQEIFWLIFHVLKHALNWNIAKIENAVRCHYSNCWVTGITRVGWSQSKSMSLSSQGLISSHDINNGISCLIVSTSLSCTFRVFSKWYYLTIFVIVTGTCQRSQVPTVIISGRFLNGLVCVFVFSLSILSNVSKSPGSLCIYVLKSIWLSRFS